MIRHVVMFKFKDDADGRSKDENVRMTKEMLDELPSKISCIIKSETKIGVKGQNPINFDLLLISDFDNFIDLNEYIEHPDHKAVGEFMRPLRESRAALDFEI